MGSIQEFFQDETITILEAEKKIVSEEVDVITGYKAMINVYMNHGISPLYQVSLSWLRFIFALFKSQ